MPRIGIFVAKRAGAKKIQTLELRWPLLPEEHPPPDAERLKALGGVVPAASSGIYSVADAALAFVSMRCRLKSAMEANWNVPSLVSASIEPSEKIL